jgi:ABC-2 type transport system ATP-binding protein
MLAIKISKVSKRYGRTTALSDVSLEVEAGEIYGFLGPNGAGKTTTIRCLMDFIRPNTGSISIFGLDAQRDSVEVKRQVGFLPADNQLYSKWNARQHISLVTGVRGGPDTSADLMARLGLDPQVPVHHLSSGNQQKLGLILALMTNPKLLVLDEPTKGLDPLLQHEIYSILKEYVAAGGTVFLSSHNLAEVEHICSNVGVIKQGKIVASKSMHDIVAMNVHIVTAAFPATAAAPDLSLPGVEIISATEGRLILKNRGDINPLMAKLGSLQLTDIEIRHAPLEEIFMEYYQDQS